MGGKGKERKTDTRRSDTVSDRRELNYKYEKGEINEPSLGKYRERNVF